MSKIVSIKPGGSLPFVFSRMGERLDGWVCTVQVQQFPDGDILIGPRVIPAVGRLWPGWLTSLETEDLAITTKLPYYLIGIITNTGTDEKQTVDSGCQRFCVSPAYG